MVKTLKTVTDNRVRAYIVWLPIFGGDFNGAARQLSRSFSDKRVSYYLDPESVTGHQWKSILNLKTSIAWDVYLLYGPSARWEDAPPEPQYWMQQLWGVTHAPRFEEPTFRAKLKAMLDEIKTAQTIDVTNRRTKIEFLYFKDCPGYRQALSNLKAAVRETKIKADLVLVPVNSEDEAKKTNFHGSPSIRVNGKDLDGKVDSPSYSCRVYQIGGRMTGTPTKEFIAERLRQHQGVP